jgi:hypothetical protein
MASMIALVGALTALGFPTQPLADPPAESALLVLVVNTPGQGSIVTTIEDAAGDITKVVCRDQKCPARYRAGQVLTLRAHAYGFSKFGFWSDDRCPPKPVCTLAMDPGEQAVVATFTPQLLSVLLSNDSVERGQLTSEPEGEPPNPFWGQSCESDEIASNVHSQVWCREFPASKETGVKLTGKGIEPFWLADDDACDAIVGTECSLVPNSRRQVALHFGGPVVPFSSPGDLDVMFRIAKGGTGSGTVRSESLDCGDKCEKELRFGERQTLVANAEASSRFVGWRGACAASPQCELNAGPVTRVTAVFDTVGKPSGTTPSGTTPQRSKRGGSTQTPFVARIGRILVPGARPRRVHFTVSVNARSSIRAVLENARGRPVSSRAWEVERGERVLRLRVPRRARRGSYVLKITARHKPDDVERFTRRVRLRR